MMRLLKPLSRAALAAALLYAAALLLWNGLAPSHARLASLIPPNGKYDVRILRDSWGVPHIFGKTDACVSYGLAWAHCEDDAATMLESLMATRGKLGTLKPFDIEALQIDFLVQALDVWGIVDANYESGIPEDVKRICEAYADGVNHYAALHARELGHAAALFPVTGKDLIAGYVFRMPFFWGFDKHLRAVLGVKTAEERMAEEQTADAAWLMERAPIGSNAIAVAPSRSADGFTRLAINSHQPWEGPVAWYEAHLHSEEGLDIVGGVFPGSPVIIHGHNQTLGWAHTVNQPDLCDAYELEINPKNPYQYKFDGEWRDLERRTARLTMRLWGPFTWTVKRELLFSVHGPAFRTENGTIALRIAGHGDVRQLEQSYRKNKATNLDEFLAAIRTGGTPSTNCVYADAAGNIYYLFNARMPKRAPGFDWTKPVPGNVSSTLWTDYEDFAALPQILNPAAGFLINCNNDPCFTTAPEEDLNRADFPPEWGIDTLMTNRALRALELYGGDPSINREEFYDYKYDQRYSENSETARLVHEVLDRYPGGDVLLDEAAAVLREWDLNCDDENTGAAIGVAVALPAIFGELTGTPAPDSYKSFVDGAKLLKKNFGKIAVPWKDVNRLVRGKVNLGLGGGPDVLNAVYGRPQPDGTLTGVAGDSYILLVEWDARGRAASQSIHNYGSATTRPDSPHYADQAPLFVERKMKPVWMDEAEIRANLKSEYRPGLP